MIESQGIVGEHRICSRGWARRVGKAVTMFPVTGQSGIHDVFVKCPEEVPGTSVPWPPFGGTKQKGPGQSAQPRYHRICRPAQWLRASVPGQWGRATTPDQAERYGGTRIAE
jgi:hypothetical protein